MPPATEFLALADTLERNGQYNIAKLLRAAAESASTREAYEHPVGSDVAAIAERLRTIGDGLSSTPAAALRAVLHNAAGALEADRVPLIEETPHPTVCRRCGRVWIDQDVERCPDCGVWSLTGHRVQPIYWLSESTPSESLQRLRSTPAVVRGLIDDVDEDALSARPAPDEWSAKEVLDHLHKAQQVLSSRLDPLLSGGDPELLSVMVWQLEAEDSSTRRLFDRYAALRSEIVDRLSHVSPRAWWNGAKHAEWGRTTLLAQVSYFANHEPTHLAQLADAIPR